MDQFTLRNSFSWSKITFKQLLFPANQKAPKFEKIISLKFDTKWLSWIFLKIALYKKSFIWVPRWVHPSRMGHPTLVTSFFRIAEHFLWCQSKGSAQLDRIGWIGSEKSIRSYFFEKVTDPILFSREGHRSDQIFSKTDQIG